MEILSAANDNAVERDLLSQDISGTPPSVHYAWNHEYGLCTFERRGQKLYLNDTLVFVHSYRATGEIDSPLNARCMYINIVEGCRRTPITEAILKVLAQHPHLIPREWWNRPIVALGTGILSGERTYIRALAYDGTNEPTLTSMDVDLVIWHDLCVAPVLQTIGEVRSALLI